MKTRKKKLIIISGTLLVIVLAVNLFIGYRFRSGLFPSLGNIRMSQLEGNNERYASSTVEPLADHPLKGKNVLFLGSSVTYGYSSLQDGIPEYFSHRFGCNVTKEAVSGTTLGNNGSNSYYSRLLNNVDPETHYDLFICQLSTNDASKKIPLGEISDDMDLASYDTKTTTGAMEYIIQYAKETWGCPVLFYTNARFDSDTYQEMVDRAYELSEKWGIGIIDLWSYEGFNNITPEERALYMDDNIHPHKAGYMLWWGPEIERQLDALSFISDI